MSDVGTVIIGRNEGERLVRCLASVSEQYGHVVYVDSGSTDGSIDAARRAGAEVIALDMTTPFTAARARNTGASAVTTYDDVDFVQFIDGDCEMQPGWLEAGTAALRANPKVAAVAGRLRERFPDATIYNRLCDMEWNIPAGEVTGLGGIALYRVEAFQNTGGFDETLIAGEEPELCLRLRRAGWKILRTADEMALHDAAMTRFGQWWQREIRSGWAYAEGAAQYGREPEHYRVAAVCRILFWGGAIPIFFILNIIAGLIFDFEQSFSIAVIIIIFILSYFAIKMIKNQNLGYHDRVLYLSFNLISKIPQIVGILIFIYVRMKNKKSTLIEYK